MSVQDNPGSAKDLIALAIGIPGWISFREGPNCIRRIQARNDSVKGGPVVVDSLEHSVRADTQCLDGALP